MGLPTRGGLEGHFNNDNYKIGQCANLLPEPESPASPPLHEQGSNITGYNQAGLNVTIEHCQLNCLIQGISVRVSRKCKESNLDNYGDCEECGNSYLHIREISDLNFLESTATSRKTYNERQRRREAILYRNGDREGSL